MIDRLVKAGVMEDSCARFPTLEMPVTDVCTRLKDALCIAATYRSVLRMLSRLR